MSPLWLQIESIDSIVCEPHEPNPPPTKDNRSLLYRILTKISLPMAQIDHTLSPKFRHRIIFAGLFSRRRWASDPAEPALYLSASFCIPLKLELAPHDPRTRARSKPCCSRASRSATAVPAVTSGRPRRRRHPNRHRHLGLDPPVISASPEEHRSLPVANTWELRRRLRPVWWARWRARTLAYVALYPPFITT